LDEASGAQHLLLTKGKRYETGPTGADMRIMEFAHLRQRLDSNNRKRKKVEVEALPMLALGDDPESRAEWHWRVSLPVFAVIGGLLAVGVSRVKPRQGRFAKVIPGMILMLAYFLALLVNQNAIAEGQIPDKIGFWVVHALFAAFAVYQLRSLGRPVATR
jgi:lipopolysaccharide export system permease protein